MQLILMALNVSTSAPALLRLPVVPPLSLPCPAATLLYHLCLPSSTRPCCAGLLMSVYISIASHVTMPISKNLK